MRLFLFKNGSFGQRGLALLMLACLSGAVCAFACGMRAQAAVAAEPTENMPAGPMASHACCKRAATREEKRKPAADALQTASDAPPASECCIANTRTLSDTPQKVKLDPLAVAVLEQPLDFTPENVASAPHFFIFHQPQPPPDQRRTYLRNCVFLI
jgi:hypothetical protein